MRSEYELVDIYADEGLSGTSMQKRDELNRLLRDCAKGKVDRIITKSVSRLSRNAKEFLETVRLLKSLGVSIYFEEQGIDTDKLNAEMILTFPGLHAQQESENISRNTRWSIQKRMARGEYFGTHAPLGYRFQNGQLTVEEPEAETVRRIFDLYLQGYGCQSIAELLNREGNVSERTNGKIFDRWYPGTVRYIIGNERYVGDARLQKQFNTDTVPYRTRNNHGERKQYYVENVHSPIVSRKIFEAVRVLLKSRTDPKCEKWERHQLNGTLICPDCGGMFRRKQQRGKAIWGCASKSKGTTSCAGRCIQEETVYRIFHLLLLKLHDYGDALFGALLDQLETLQAVTADNPERFQALNLEISNLAAQNLVLTRLHNKKLLPIEDYYAQSGDIDRQIWNLQNKRKRLLQEQDEFETVENSHPAIIDAETFGQVQEELARRSSKMDGKKVGDKTLQRKYSGKYAMSDLLICGECGSAYRRCTWTAKGEKQIVWRCMNRLEHGKQNCKHSPTLDESNLQAAVMDAITERVKNDPKLLRTLQTEIEKGLTANTPTQSDIQGITDRIAEIDRKFADLLRTVSIGNDSAHDAELEALMKEKNALHQRLQAMEQGSTQHDKRKENLTAILPILRNRPLPYDDTLVRQTVKGIIADSKTKIRVVFPDGETVEQMVW